MTRVTFSARSSCHTYHVVYTRSKKNRLISLFVVAFICLNAGGAVCVAYCRSMPSAAEEHCPLKKTDSHCHKGSKGENSSEATSVAGDEIFCCSVTVGFIPAPVEKLFRFTNIVSTALVDTHTIEPRLVSIPSFTSTFDYRGPPPLDRRVERIKLRLLRI